MKVIKDFYFKFDRPVTEIRLEIAVDDSSPKSMVGNEQSASYDLNMNVKAFPTKFDK